MLSQVSLDAVCAAELHFPEQVPQLCMVCAGHINFNDEVSAALRLADGVLLAVDAAEGVMMVTDKVIKQAVAEGLPICLLLTKVTISACSQTLPVRAIALPDMVVGACDQLHCELEPLLSCSRTNCRVDNH